nr:MAG TPA: hypothetical protein [Caudoviricetes sp.]
MVKTELLHGIENRRIFAVLVSGSALNNRH